MPARVGFYDATGRTPLPSEQAILVHRYADETRLFWVAPQLAWPSTNRQAFYVRGTYEAQVPEGAYQLVVTKGPEYRAHKAAITVRAGQTGALTVSLQRYLNQPMRGWFSGDTHLHLMRDTTDDLDVWGQVAAEDVSVGNLLEMGNIVTTHFRQPAWGKAGRFVRDGHMIASGQEDPRTTQRGHTIHHNLAKPFHLATDEFFAYHKVFEASHAQGGVSGYAHHGQLFNGRRGLALDVPFGLVDFIEVLQGGRLDTAAWYPFLNLGYKVSPAAGSDYPYFGPSLPGAERYYVKLDRDFDADAWYASFKAGHVFVTNGPMLDFTVNGEPMGEELRVAKGTKLDIAAAAQLNPDIDQLGRLEIVVQGDVVATQPAKGLDHVAIRKTLVADRSMWIAVSAFGTANTRRARCRRGAGRAQRADLRRRRRPAVLQDVGGRAAGEGAAAAPAGSADGACRSDGRSGGVGDRGRAVAPVGAAAPGFEAARRGSGPEVSAAARQAAHGVAAGSMSRGSRRVAPSAAAAYWSRRIL